MLGLSIFAQWHGPACLKKNRRRPGQGHVRERRRKKERSRTRRRKAVENRRMRRNARVHPLAYRPLSPSRLSSTGKSRAHNSHLGSSLLFNTGNGNLLPFLYFHSGSSCHVTHGNPKAHLLSGPAFAGIQKIKRPIQPDDTALCSVQ